MSEHVNGHELPWEFGLPPSTSPVDDELVDAVEVFVLPVLEEIVRRLQWARDSLAGSVESHVNTTAARNVRIALGAADELLKTLRKEGA